MEPLSGYVAYPSIEQIIEVNRQMIEKSGGSFVKPDNLSNRASLEYILTAIVYPIFGKLLWPTLEEKASPNHDPCYGYCAANAVKREHIYDGHALQRNGLFGAGRLSPGSKTTACCGASWVVGDAKKPVYARPPPVVD